MSFTSSPRGAGPIAHHLKERPAVSPAQSGDSLSSTREQCGSAQALHLGKEKRDEEGRGKQHPFSSENLTPEFSLGSGSTSATKSDVTLLNGGLPSAGSPFSSLLSFYSSNDAFISELFYICLFLSHSLLFLFYGTYSFISLSHLIYLLLHSF